MRHWKIAAIVGAGMWSAAPLRAQVEGGADSQPASLKPPPQAATEVADVELLDLEVATVVTAARHEQPIDTVPYAVTVITAEDIRRSGVRSVPDALRLAAGVDVAELSYGNAAVSPRGMHGFLAHATLVLVDGRQIFDPFFGGTVWGSWPFQLEDIERIEVIRGPGGVTWGANAMNGVINIITKDPKDQAGLTATGGGGSRGANKEHLGYAFGDDKFRLRISGEYEGSDGFKHGGNVLRGLDDQYQNGRAGVHGVYDFSPKDRLTFSVGNSVQDAGFPPTPLTLGATTGGGSQSNFVLGRWSHEFEADNSLELTGFVNDFQVTPSMRAADYRYQQYALQLGHQFKPAPEHTVSWGIDTRLDVFDSSNADPMMTSSDYVRSGTVGVYAQDQWQFAPRWRLDLGGRVDYDSYGGFQPSGRAALSYQLTKNTSVYGAVSRAFQMAPGALRLVDMPMLGGLARVRADQELSAQTLIAYEAGWRGRFLAGKLDLAANAFWHEYWDLTTLSPRPGPPSLVRMEIDNRATAGLYGAELEGRYSLTPRWSVLGNYTYQQLDWESIAPYHDKDLISPPRHKFMSGTTFDATDDLHLSAFLYFVDDVESPNPANPFRARHVPHYFRLDLRGEYEFWEDRASIAVGVRNLLDDYHPEGSTLFLNNAEVPRMVYAELRIRFK
ncbi:MAG: TonB-dependent receptor [Phycisphaerae bacterium]|jgi:iron complex outermembrane receptor protein